MSTDAIVPVQKIDTWNTDIKLINRHCKDMLGTHIFDTWSKMVTGNHGWYKGGISQGVAVSLLQLLIWAINPLLVL